MRRRMGARIARAITTAEEPEDKRAEFVKWKTLCPKPTRVPLKCPCSRAGPSHLQAEGDHCPSSLLSPACCRRGVPTPGCSGSSCCCCTPGVGRVRDWSGSYWETCKWKQIKHYRRDSSGSWVPGNSFLQGVEVPFISSEILPFSKRQGFFSWRANNPNSAEKQHLEMPFSYL